MNTAREEARQTAYEYGQEAADQLPPLDSFGAQAEAEERFGHADRQLVRDFLDGFENARQEEGA